MTERPKCCLCLGNELEKAPEQEPRSRRFHVRCRVCGHFVVSEAGWGHLWDSNRVDASDRLVLSTYTRQYWERRNKPFAISTGHIRAPSKSLGFRFMSVLDKIDAVVRALAEKSTSLGSIVELSWHDWPLFQAHSGDELREIVSHLQAVNLVAVAIGWREVNCGYFARVSLTVKGWEHAAVLRERKKPGQAFVAISFHSSMKDAKRAILQTLSDCHYEPKMSNDPPHNDKICDRIMALIRQSGLVVADVTRQSQGVYYEAGFAQGLGIPVVWTCCDRDRRRLHFDTRQFNHILWSDIADLKVQLKDRIEGTAPRRG